MNTIGDRIKTLIKNKNLKQKDLAEKIGVKPNTFTRWVNGNRIPDILTLRRIAFVLETSTSYLVGETDDPSVMDFSPEDIFKKAEQGDKLCQPTTSTSQIHASETKSDPKGNGLTLDDSSTSLILEYLCCRFKRDREQMTEEELKEALEKLYKCADYLANGQRETKSA